MSSSTGHTGALSRALTGDDLPCLNSPTTKTWNDGSSSRFLADPSRLARSGRLYAVAAWTPRLTTESAFCTDADLAAAFGSPAISPYSSRYQLCMVCRTKYPRGRAPGPLSTANAVAELVSTVRAHGNK